MGPVVAAAIIMSFPLNGSVTADGGDYAIVDFEVPAGTVEIEHHTANTQNILDWATSTRRRKTPGAAPVATVLAPPC